VLVGSFVPKDVPRLQLATSYTYKGVGSESCEESNRWEGKQLEYFSYCLWMQF
jgi:hypothetical protein